MTEEKTTPQPTDPKAEHRRRVRALLERLSPGTLAFIDSARKTFPNARMTNLEVTHEDGTRSKITVPKTNQEKQR